MLGVSFVMYGIILIYDKAETVSVISKIYHSSEASSLYATMHVLCPEHHFRGLKRSFKTIKAGGMALSVPSMEERPIPARVSSVIEVDTVASSAGRETPPPEAAASDSSSILANSPPIPVGILSRHILHKKHLRQKLFLHIVVETLIATGAITIIKQKHRIALKSLDAKLQGELEMYLTMNFTPIRADHCEYEYDLLNLDSPPPTYAIAKEEPPAYFILRDGEVRARIPSISGSNEDGFSGVLDPNASPSHIEIDIPQNVYTLESSPTSSDFRPPSYRSADRSSWMTNSSGDR
ncbi:hypothetical protein K493DRAFT_339292 [Basidiobolus meristosporus CBS 931.73]|uniref:Uncharacterized protein n=1 Tax=Basidiobolus meristosporus CBS 931.73 TaxID=1314790 RepID=A0A1Y1Y1C4_9FUNG|nr:hypothetical protein K493DRAFT_339292 [Basidiobolus meristosporus CBS 931.73]|eukprot:ORX91516.1 hypothetical protein K493DRAFT_339292 [Basidiobolus meristosporus CBS 931.73]